MSMASRSLRCIAAVKALTCSKLIGLVLSGRLMYASRRPALFRNDCNTELCGYPTCRLLALRCDARDRPARAFQDVWWRRLRRAAIERRFRCIGHVKLNGLGNLLAA